MSSDNSSPWNIAPPASASPKAVSPWAVSPFQTSNPFKSPETFSSLAETEPEPDVVSSAAMKNLPATTKPASVFSAAFEPVNEAEEPVASSPWAVAPIAKAEDTVSASAWTSAAPDAAEQVKEETPTLVEESIALVVEEVVGDEVAIEEKEEPEVQTQGEGTTSAWTSVFAQEAAASALSTAHVVNDADVMEEAGAVDEPAVAAVSALLELAEEAPASVVDEIVVPHEEEVEEPSCAASTAWTTAPVEEAASSAWTSAPILDEAAPVVAKVEAAVEAFDALKEVVEPVVESAAVVEEIPVETASPRTAASVHEEATPVEIVTPGLAVETPEPAVEKTEFVMMARKLVAESPIEEDGLPTGAWNSNSVQEEVVMEPAPAKEEPIEQEVAAVVEAEKAVFATPSAWNTTPVEEVKADEIERAKSIKEAKPVQEPAVVKEVPKEVPVAAVKEVVKTTEAIVENGKVDKKAIANAFDGVAIYKVDSVSKVKKTPTVEATASKSVDAPGACGACGVGSCSIQ